MTYFYKNESNETNIENDFRPSDWHQRNVSCVYLTPVEFHSSSKFRTESRYSSNSSGFFAFALTIIVNYSANTKFIFEIDDVWIDFKCIWIGRM